MHPSNYQCTFCQVTTCFICFFLFSNYAVCRWRGGRKIKLEGSDHVPVYVILRDVPDLPTHSTPSIAVRYIPEVRGWQQSIGEKHFNCLAADEHICISIYNFSCHQDSRLCFPNSLSRVIH